MPNVFSKLAFQEWGLSMAPTVAQWIRSYGRHRQTIQRSILLIFLLRSVMSMRQFIIAFRKGGKSKDRKTQKKMQQEKKKVEVRKE
jgi:ATP-binding cassette subfamily D (ALD) long-chain fatty acid import protein